MTNKFPYSTFHSCKKTQFLLCKDAFYVYVCAEIARRARLHSSTIFYSANFSEHNSRPENYRYFATEGCVINGTAILKNKIFAETNIIMWTYERTSIHTCIMQTKCRSVLIIRRRGLQYRSEKYRSLYHNTSFWPHCLGPLIP